MICSNLGSIQSHPVLYFFVSILKKAQANQYENARNVCIFMRRLGRQKKRKGKERENGRFPDGEGDIVH